jgi:hypothetical protein
MQYKVLLARPTYRGSERKEVGRWFANTLLKCKSDPRISQVLDIQEDDTPAPMVRNAILKAGIDLGVDIVCMIDDDMEPDIPRPGALPFWDTAFAFMTGPHAGRPCFVAAPYCGAPPLEAVMAFKWCNWQSDNPNHDMRIELISREEAAQRSGIERVPAAATGLCMVSVEAYKNLPKKCLPWFKYEFTDEYQWRKSTTEDAYFSRNIGLCGVPIYVHWDCWAAHWKLKRVMPPQVLTSDMIIKDYQEAILRGQRRDRKLVMIGEGKNGHVPFLSAKPGTQPMTAGSTPFASLQPGRTMTPAEVSARMQEDFAPRAGPPARPFNLKAYLAAGGKTAAEREAEWSPAEQQAARQRIAEREAKWQEDREREIARLKNEYIETAKE